MDSLLNRYRNVTVLLLVIFAQLLLLAYQVRSNQDVRLIRVWSVTAITPLARVIEGVRGGTTSVLENYILYHNLVDENRQLRAGMDKLKLENQHLRSELEMADRLKALSAFQASTPSQTLAARVIAAGVGSNSRVVFIDRGSTSGVMNGMAVITPDGIVGKITAAYPTASQVLLITDASFAAGVISQKQRVHGTVKGMGHSGSCSVDYVQNEQKVDVGEVFYTSGDDRIFPKGLPVGTVTAVRPGPQTKQIFLTPIGLQRGLEEVLIILKGVHEQIPEYKLPAAGVYLMPPPAAEAASQGPVDSSGSATAGTDADRLRERYKAIGEAQNHTFGEGTPGSKPPDFNLKPEQARPQGAAPQPGVAGPAPGVQPTPAPGAPRTAPVIPKTVPATPNPAPAGGAPLERLRPEKPAPSTEAPQGR